MLVTENFDVSEDGLSYDFDTFFQGIIGVQTNEPSLLTESKKKKNKKRKTKAPSMSLLEPFGRSASLPTATPTPLVNRPEITA